MTEIEVQIERNGATERAAGTYEPRAGRCHLELNLHDGRVLQADEADYFEALVTIRRELEAEGARVICQGARRDVWPSGMARDMGAGLKAYVLVPGQRPTRDDLVGIFEAADPSLIGTVAEQEVASRSWLASFR